MCQLWRKMRGMSDCSIGVRRRRRVSEIHATGTLRIVVKLRPPLVCPWGLPWSFVLPRGPRKRGRGTSMGTEILRVETRTLAHMTYRQKLLFKEISQYINVNLEWVVRLRFRQLGHSIVLPKETGHGARSLVVLLKPSRNPKVDEIVFWERCLEATAGYCPTLRVGGKVIRLGVIAFGKETFGVHHDVISGTVAVHAHE